MAETKKIKTALVSVFHKDGLDELLKELNNQGVKFLSTGGTQSFIESLGYECQAVEDLTTYPSILGGRVKTLHPKVFGGILGRRENEGDKEQIYQLIENLEIEGLDDPSKPWNKFTVYKESMQNKNTQNYEETGRLVPSFHQADTKAQTDETLKFEKVAEYTSFRSFLTGVEIDTSDFDGGINAILKKIDIAKKWYSEKWGLDLYAIRREVRIRQNNINEYVKGNVTIYDYQ
jgi:hypothetical protein